MAFKDRTRLAFVVYVLNDTKYKLGCHSHNTNDSAAFSPFVSASTLINSLQKYNIHFSIVFSHSYLFLPFHYFVEAGRFFYTLLKVCLSVIESWQKVKSGILTLRCCLSRIVIWARQVPRWRPSGHSITGWGSNFVTL